MSRSRSQAEGRPPYRYAGWYALGLLAFVNFLNYGTRNVIFTVYGDLRLEFGLSNAEIGVLGTAFMVAHALATVPVGWAADRLDRRHVIAAGVLTWSLANLAAAGSLGFSSLLASRILAGIGTAACVPVVNALLPDLFPARDKARVVSIFSLGLFLGGAVGFGLGALVGFPGAFLAMAAPGLLVVALVWRLEAPARRPGVGQLPVSLAAFARDLRSVWVLPGMRWMLAAAALMAFAAGGMVAWLADFAVQTKGMSVGRATAVFGVCAVTGGLAGVIAGGVVGDRLQSRLAHGRMAAMVIGFSCTIPFALLTVFVDSGPVFLAGIWLMMFFITWYHGPMAAVVDDLSASQRAATSQAAFIFTMHLLGTAPSAYAVGFLADHVGLRYALLAPIGAIALAALAVTAAFRHAARDCAITTPS